MSEKEKFNKRLSDNAAKSAADIAGDYAKEAADIEHRGSESGKLRAALKYAAGKLVKHNLGRAVGLYKAANVANAVLYSDPAGEGSDTLPEDEQKKKDAVNKEHWNKRVEALKKRAIPIKMD
jgi:hypothetical protein